MENSGAVREAGSGNHCDKHTQEPCAVCVCVMSVLLRVSVFTHHLSVVLLSK